MRPLSRIDLDHMLERTNTPWADLRGERVFLTGGTGFFGSWLVESFLHANRTLGLGARMTMLSRAPADFAARAPSLCRDPALSLLQGDIRSFAFPAGHFGLIIHAAKDSVVPLSASAAEQYGSIVEGMRRILKFAAGAGTERLLFASSGAVYGTQPLSVSHMDEEQPFAQSDSPYTLGKRDAEALCVKASPGLHCTIARGFAFVGPHLQLDAHFAVGNFLRDALVGKDVVLEGDGTPLRSYLYAADLAIWLWTILLKGAPGRAYNVGAEEAVSIKALAERVVEVVNPGLSVRVPRPALQPGVVQRYLPSTRRARSELGLEAWIGLDEAIRRTAAWHREASV